MHTHREIHLDIYTQGLSGRHAHTHTERYTQTYTQGHSGRQVQTHTHRQSWHTDIQLLEPVNRQTLIQLNYRQSECSVLFTLTHTQTYTQEHSGRHAHTHTHRQSWHTDIQLLEPVNRQTLIQLNYRQSVCSVLFTLTACFKLTTSLHQRHFLSYLGHGITQLTQRDWCLRPLHESEWMQ